MKTKLTNLPNQMNIFTEEAHSTHAVSLAIAVRRGSRHEPIEHAGLSHFLEHLVFKGTKKYSAYKIVHEVESRGGDINAFTARDLTCYHAVCLKEDVTKVISILSDLVRNAKLTEKDIQTEKEVILQEIAMTKDNPEEWIYDLFYESFFRGQAVGKPILGTPESLEKLHLKEIREYYADNYTPENIFVAAVGPVSHSQIVSEVKKHFPKRASKKAPLGVMEPVPESFFKVQNKRSEQVHLLIGFPENRAPKGVFYEMAVLNAYLAGGMTSKLYQEVREKRGLCYSIYGLYNQFQDVGVYNIYTGTDQTNVALAFALILKELEKIRKKGISEKDFKVFQKQILSNVKLNWDDLDSRMNTILVDSAFRRNVRSQEEIKAGIEAITCKSLQAYIRDQLDFSKLAIFTIGSLSTTQKNKMQNMWKRFVRDSG